MAGARIGDAIKPVLSALNEMGIRYFAGGSVASSIHGIARYTQGVDLVADLKPGQIDELVSRLVRSFTPTQVRYETQYATTGRST
jgi:hypothetical protein